jgi:hypothetical protein
MALPVTWLMQLRIPLEGIRQSFFRVLILTRDNTATARRRRGDRIEKLRAGVH